MQPGGFPSAYTETTLSAKPSERLVDAPMSDPFEAKSVPSFQPDTLAAETNYNCLRIQNLLCSVEKKRYCFKLNLKLGLVKSSSVSA